MNSVKVILSDIAGTIIKAFTAVTALTSVFVYIYKRQKIPTVSFGGYFKVDRVFITGNVQSKVTTYYVKIEDINPKSEGKIKSCVGYLIVGSEHYNATWMFVDTTQHTFVKQAWLKLFDVNPRDETLGFFSNGKRHPASIGRRMGDSVTIQLNAARGHCPTITEKIENIIREAHYFS
jgi:hypothetical protein